MAEPYELLKKATRGRQLDENSYHSILKELNLPENAMNELKSLKPEAYTGLATQLTSEND